MIDTQVRVREILAFARKNPCDARDISPMNPPDPDRSVTIDGILAVFTYNIDPVAGPTRYLQLSKPGETPDPVAGKAIARLFGFRTDRVTGLLLGPDPQGPCIVLLTESEPS